MGHGVLRGVVHPTANTAGEVKPLSETTRDLPMEQAPLTPSDSGARVVAQLPTCPLCGARRVGPANARVSGPDRPFRAGWVGGLLHMAGACSGQMSAYQAVP